VAPTTAVPSIVGAELLCGASAAAGPAATTASASRAPKTSDRLLSVAVPVVAQIRGPVDREAASDERAE
jgi:hypothetical protein